jgi:hypothetical protein
MCKLDMDIFTFDSVFRSGLSADDYGFNRPDCQYGKGQHIKYRNLTQVENVMKVNIKIEWHCNNDDYQGRYYYLITVWNESGFYRFGLIVSILRHF